MKIDFGAVIVDIKGAPLIGKGGAPATLGSVAAEALLATYSDEKGLEPREKVARFTLAEVCANETEADISVEDVVLLKSLIGKAYGPLVVGRAYEIIGG